MTDAVDFFKKQDLAEYLHLGSLGSLAKLTVSCPFHPDKHPSASIFRTGSGHVLFHCHSSHCGVKGSILDMAAKVHSLTGTKAVLQHLMTHYHVKIETGWKEAQKALLQNNTALLEDEETLRQLYPNLYRVIGRVRGDLLTKLKLAESYVVSERHQHNGGAIFFCSLRHFQAIHRGNEEDPAHFGRQNERIDRYCLLGLMRKVPDAELPTEMLTQARRRQLQGRHAYRIQCYQIPAYTRDILQQAEERARILRTAGASMRGISSDLIEDLFGKDVLQAVYPQRPSEKRPRCVDPFLAKMEEALVLDLRHRGYTTTTWLQKALMHSHNWGSVTQRRIEKYLPGLLGKLGLRKVFCNKALKERLGIAVRGYPRIILATPALSPAKPPPSAA